ASPGAKVPVNTTCSGLLQTPECGPLIHKPPPVQVESATHAVPSLVPPEQRCVPMLQSPHVPPPVHVESTVHTVPSLVPPEHCLVPSRHAKVVVPVGDVKLQVQVGSSRSPLPLTSALQLVLVEPESPWLQLELGHCAFAVHFLPMFAPAPQTFC